MDSEFVLQKYYKNNYQSLCSASALFRVLNSNCVLKTISQSAFVMEVESVLFADKVCAECLREEILDWHRCRFHEPGEGL